MSENIPESIPTSADPRSKRPLKKRALSPRSQNAAQVEALFSKPDQEIKIPSSNQSTSLTRAQQLSTAPEIVANVQGSSAGAGSGEFHVYKASRRREYERLRAMDEEVRNEEEADKWDREKRGREEKDRERTRKNREKREKLKKRKGGKGAGKVEEEVSKKANGGGIKARTDLGRDGDDSKDAVSNEGVEEVQPQGLVIHDDD